MVFMVSLSSSIWHQIDQRICDHVRQMADGCRRVIVYFIIQNQWNCSKRQYKITKFRNFFLWSQGGRGDNIVCIFQKRIGGT